MGFQKGNTVRLGVKHTIETRKKMCVSHKGYRHSEETKRKIGLAHKGMKPPNGHMEKMTKAYIEKCSGPNHPNWKGGRRKSGKYVMILQPSHPFCTNTGYIMEHRVIMEKSLGRYLKPTELVHHKNGNRIDNRIENLELFKNWSSHMKLHRHLQSNGVTRL